MKVLIVEDEKKIVAFLKKGLVSEGITVDSSNDGADGLFKATESTYDVIVLDVMLPGKDGLSICKELRAKNINTPIIMLTARYSIEDRVKGLEAGADDYLIKPFSFAELTARIHALARRSPMLKTPPVTVADLTIEPKLHMVRRSGKEINLSATEFRILQYLIQNMDKVISKTELLENIWGYDFDPGTNIVEVYIKYLRDKIDRPWKNKLIKTVHGVGYKICG